MPPEPAHALEQHVGRREIGDDEIQVDIDALLDDLRGDEDRARAVRLRVLCRAARATRFSNSCRRKNGNRLCSKPTSTRSARTLARERAAGRLRLGNGVAQIEHMLPGFGARDAFLQRSPPPEAARF